MGFRAASDNQKEGIGKAFVRFGLFEAFYYEENILGLTQVPAIDKNLLSAGMPYFLRRSFRVSASTDLSTGSTALGQTSILF